MSLLSNLGHAVTDTVSNQLRLTPTGITSGETMVDPSNAHGHQGDNDIFILTRDDRDFQLFRSHDDVTFIHGNNDTASYYGLSAFSGGNQTIYDYGHGTTLRFSELEQATVKVYGFENDPSGKIVLFNPTNMVIQPDGHGGTLLGNIDFIGYSKLSASQVSVRHTDTPVSLGGVQPL
jgi:hypothetical protein